MNKNFFFSVFLLGAFFTGCKIDVHHDEPLPRLPSCQMDVNYVEVYSGDSRYWRPIVTCSVKHARNNAICQISFRDLDYDPAPIYNQTPADLNSFGNATISVATDSYCRIARYDNMDWHAECLVDGHVLKVLDTHGPLPCKAFPYVD